MSIVTKWMLEQGMAVALECVAGQSKELLGLENFEARMSKKLDIVNHKLDRLLQAPFKEALIYLRQGDLHMCHLRVVSAMAFDELNMAAMVLHCLLLRGEGRTDMALTYYEMIADRFGWHRDIIPLTLLESLRMYPESVRPLSAIDGFSFPIPCTKASPIVYFTLNHLVVWVPYDGGLLDSLFGRNSLLIAVRWDGKEILRLEGRSIDLLAVTKEYLVLSRKDEDPQVVALGQSLKGGAVASHDVKELFCRDAGVVCHTLNGNSPSVSFAGASLTLEDYTIRHVERRGSFTTGSGAIMMSDTARRLIIHGERPFRGAPVKELKAVHVISRDGSQVEKYEDLRRGELAIELEEALGGQVVVVFLQDIMARRRIDIWMEYEVELFVARGLERLCLTGSCRKVSGWREISYEDYYPDADNWLDIRYEIPSLDLPGHYFRAIDRTKVIDAADSAGGPEWGQLAALMDPAFKEGPVRPFVRCVHLSLMVQGVEIVSLALNSTPY